MRWEDEAYVKVYTRDEADFLALGWQARSVFYELMRKVDRAGFLSLGKGASRSTVTGGHTASHAVTRLAVVLRIPEEVIAATLPVLVEDGCVAEVNGGILLPNFIEAQASRSTDKARQRTSREKARDIAKLSDRHKAINEESDRHTSSQAVTRGHDSSHAVTLRREEKRLEETRREGFAREGVRVPELAPPEDLHLSPRVVTDCEIAGLRMPTAADVVAMRANYDRDGRSCTNWEAALVRWMGHAKVLEARTHRDTKPGNAAQGPLCVAYEAGITAGQGAPYALPQGDHEPELERVFRIHGISQRPDRKGEHLPTEEAADWVREEAQGFAAWLVAMERAKPGEARWWSGFAPKGWAKYMNELATDEATKAEKAPIHLPKGATP